MNKPKPQVSNDNVTLVPLTSFEGHALEFDFPALQIGVAEYEEGPTGCTVFYFPKGVSAAVDIRGGSPGVIETDYGWYQAICFAGGSLYGLEAAMGVRAEILSKNNYKISWETTPLVSGAIIWDWPGRDNAIYPDKALGRAALKSAKTGIFPLGPHGAGRSAGCGGGLGQRESTGQGGAFRQIGAAKIAVFTVVNALGAIVNREGKVVRGGGDPKTGVRQRAIDAIEQKWRQAQGKEAPKGNTTLTLALTNQKLGGGALQQFARQVHSSMARAIQPFHTPHDGDVLYAATTNEVKNEAINEFALGVIASEVAWDAVLSCYQDSDENNQ